MALNKSLYKFLGVSAFVMSALFVLFSFVLYRSGGNYTRGGHRLGLGSHRRIYLMKKSNNKGMRNADFGMRIEKTRAFLNPKFAFRNDNPQSAIEHMPVVKKRNQQTESRLLLEGDDR